MLQTNLYNIAAAAIVHEPSMAQFPEPFQDEMLFNLDFLDDRVWNMGMGDVSMFGGATM